MSALNLGINSYSFLKLFRFESDPMFINRYLEYYGKVPKGFYVSNLNKKPVSYFDKGEISILKEKVRKGLIDKLTDGI